MRGGKASRKKGDRFERLLRDLFRERGIACKRVPLSGSAPDFKSDLIVTLGGREYTIEAKVRASGFRRIYDWLNDSDIVCVKSDFKTPVVAMPLSVFLRLVR